MYLAIYFQLDRFSTKSLEELNIHKHFETKKGDDYIYSIGTRAWEHSYGTDNRKSLGWIMGKKIISGLKSHKPQLIEKNKQFIDFIIRIDDEGKEITFTCNEDKLANFYGLNKGAPNYVTPIAFRKDVLTKYRSQPDKYTIDDGYLHCGGMWGLRMDNNHPEYISVMLGDLGHLTYKEQQYWRSFNLPITGKMSKTAWERGFEVKFTDPASSDLYLKQKYTDFQHKWRKKYNWDFFLPLSKEDAHHFKTLGIWTLNSLENRFLR